LRFYDTVQIRIQFLSVNYQGHEKAIWGIQANIFWLFQCQHRLLLKYQNMHEAGPHFWKEQVDNCILAISRLPERNLNVHRGLFERL